jgi:hypothetical protein
MKLCIWDGFYTTSTELTSSHDSSDKEHVDWKLPVCFEETQESANLLVVVFPRIAGP